MLEATKHSNTSEASGKSQQDAPFENTSSVATRLSSTGGADISAFVDHAPTPDVKVLPPAKYKLWLLVFVLVYLAVLVSTSADFLGFLRFNGWLSPNASLFLQFSIIVFILVYGTLDLVITCFTFRAKSGKVYGIGAWLKQPRAQWMYQHDNLLFEILARIIRILEDGFSMFDAPPSPMQVVNQLPTPLFECSNGQCERTLKIEHRIKPDKLDEYKQWATRIRLAIESAHGFVGAETTEIIKEWDEEEGGRSEIQPDDTDKNNDNQGASADADDKPLYHVVYCTFSNIDHLNDWMVSPRRKVLMKALEPMLATPDVVKVQARRHLPDAFTDLATRQGNAVPKSPPKKWKVWWITLVALYITVQWSGSFMPYYYDKWGLTQADWRVTSIASAFVVTFLNTYVMIPLFLFLFDHWLQRSDVKNVRQPWKSLDEGFQSIWPKVILTFAFYGGCGIAAIVKNF